MLLLFVLYFSSVFKTILKSFKKRNVYLESKIYLCDEYVN